PATRERFKPNPSNQPPVPGRNGVLPILKPILLTALLLRWFQRREIIERIHLSSPLHPASDSRKRIPLRREGPRELPHRAELPRTESSVTVHSGSRAARRA